MASAVANVLEKDFAFLFPLLCASFPLFSLHFSPHCYAGGGAEVGGMAQVGERVCPVALFFPLI